MDDHPGDSLIRKLENDVENLKEKINEMSSWFTRIQREMVVSCKSKSSRLEYNMELLRGPIDMKLNRINNLEAEFLLSQEMFWKGRLREVEHTYENVLKKLIRIKNVNAKQNVGTQTNLCKCNANKTDVALQVNMINDKRVYFKKENKSDGNIQIPNHSVHIHANNRPTSALQSRSFENNNLISDQNTRIAAKQSLQNRYDVRNNIYNERIVRNTSCNDRFVNAVMEQFETKMKDIGLDASCNRIRKDLMESKLALIKHQENMTAKDIRAFFHWKKVCLMALEHRLNNADGYKTAAVSSSAEDHNEVLFRGNQILLMKPKGFRCSDVLT